MSKTEALRRLKRLYWKSRIAEHCKTSLNRVRKDILAEQEAKEVKKDEIRS